MIILSDPYGKKVRVHNYTRRNGSLIIPAAVARPAMARLRGLTHGAYFAGQHYTFCGPYDSTITIDLSYGRWNNDRPSARRAINPQPTLFKE